MEFTTIKGLENKYWVIEGKQHFVVINLMDNGQFNTKFKNTSEYPGVDKASFTSLEAAKLWCLSKIDYANKDVRGGF